MAVPFPLTPIPTYFADCSFPKRNGVFYVGDTPSITLSQSGATGYSVRDYFGTVVSSGSFTGTTCTPTAPVGGWAPGWYRIYFTGANTDSLYGPSYGVTNFCVIRTNTDFITMPAAGTYGGAGGESRDLLMKGVLGIGTSRLSIYDVTNLHAPLTPVTNQGNDSLDVCVTDAAVGATYWSNPGSPYADANRPRPMFCQIPNGGADRLQLPGSTGGTNYLNCYAATAFAATGNVHLAIAAGSSSGSKVTVFYPDAVTVVETYDNQATATAAAAAINAASIYIVACIPGASANAAGGTLSPTAIPNVLYTGVSAVVAGLYPTVTRFEGPTNEPADSSTIQASNIVQQMRLFQAAVHAGNASAKAIGPCLVDILSDQHWDSFFAQGGGVYCDEVSAHAYNTATNGDINYGRNSITTWLAILAAHSITAPIWLTEGGGMSFTSVYGVLHPRRARVPLLQTLLWEQYGVPRERNLVWYDVAHGFWSFPSWLENSDTSLNPMALLFRVLAEETFGQTHNQILDFGTPGNQIFLGSVYTTPGGGTSTAVIQCASHMPNNQITLSVTGTTSPLTVVNGFGVTSTVPIVGGLAVIPVGEIPTYIRLPVGAAITVFSCRDWAPSQSANKALTSTAKIGGVTNTVINSGAFMTNYANSTGVARSTGSLPDTAELDWGSAQKIDRVIIWCGPAWQNMAGLVAFDVQTTVDGTTWVTQSTVTKTTPTSFQHGSDNRSGGCEQETYWDEQWIFDVEFSPVQALGVRLQVTATSFGGEPDAAAITAGGQGSNTGPGANAGIEQLVLTQIGAFAGNFVVNILPPRASARVI